ncbi:uncharacterized protein LOC141915274 [Tubulanus polymorphus]|uniref:uncharacterized protein LOC141915274 n=1 Tax=Tubulanus polymorphus TaxID=672921 RepID=UPI003DA308E8
MAFIGKLGQLFHGHSGDGGNALDHRPEIKTPKRKKDALLADLQKEKALRMEAEAKLQEMMVESDNSKSRLQALEGEFKKMEDVVQNMLQYKNKLDQIRQEKANLTFTYEEQLQRYQSQICNLEQENMLLMNEVGKLETQVNERNAEEERHSILMARLKNLEAENSQLVLENEQQRMQYEKSLGEIANQVVQALLTQKGLREECLKLQKRVSDLEQQNQQLNFYLQHRRYISPDSFLQSPTTHSQGMSWPVCNNTTQHALSPSQYSNQQIRNNLLKQRLSVQSPTSVSGNEHCFSPTNDDNFNDNAYIDTPCMPTMSSPPPWLRDRIKRLPAKTDLTEPQINTTGSSIIPNVGDSPTESTSIILSSSQIGAHYKLDPSPNLSPNYSKPWSQKLLNNINHIHGKNEETTTPQNNAQDAKYEIIYGGRKNAESWNIDGTSSTSIDNAETVQLIPNPNTASHEHRETSPGRELLKLSDSFDIKFTINDNDGLPIVIGGGENQAQDSDDSSDYETRSLSTGLSGACSSTSSSVSLNDILETGLDSMQTPSDDNLSLSSFQELFNSHFNKTKGSIRGSFTKVDEKHTHGIATCPYGNSTNDHKSCLDDLMFNAIDVSIEEKNSQSNICRPNSLELIQCSQNQHKKTRSLDNKDCAPAKSQKKFTKKQSVTNTLPAKLGLMNNCSKFMKKPTIKIASTSRDKNECSKPSENSVCIKHEENVLLTKPETLNTAESNTNIVAQSGTGDFVKELSPPKMLIETIQMHVLADPVKFITPKSVLKLSSNSSACSSPGSELDRSGSADDGYSTMASDVNPEILERFSEGVKSSASDKLSEKCKCLKIEEIHEPDDQNTTKCPQSVEKLQTGAEDAVSESLRRDASVECSSIGSVKDILRYFERQLLAQRSARNRSTVSLPGNIVENSKFKLNSEKSASIDVSLHCETDSNKSNICCSLCKHKRPRQFLRNAENLECMNLVQSEALLYYTLSQEFNDDFMKRAYSDSDLLDSYLDATIPTVNKPLESDDSNGVSSSNSSMESNGQQPIYSFSKQNSSIIDSVAQSVDVNRHLNVQLQSELQHQKHFSTSKQVKPTNECIKNTAPSNKNILRPKKKAPPVPKKPTIKSRLLNKEKDVESNSKSFSKSLEKTKPKQKPKVPVRTSSLTRTPKKETQTPREKTNDTKKESTPQKVTNIPSLIVKSGGRKSDKNATVKTADSNTFRAVKDQTVNSVHPTDFAVQPVTVFSDMNNFDGEFMNLVGNKRPSSWSLEGHTGNKSSTELLDRSCEDIEQFLSSTGEEVLDLNSTIFNKDFYSLCKVESSRSLESNSANSTPATRRRHLGSRTSSVPNCSVVGGEDEEISKQIADLSRTVDHLQKSLSSLDSLDETDINVPDLKVLLAPVSNVVENATSTREKNKLETSIKESIQNVWPEFRLSNLSISSCSSVSGGLPLDTRIPDSDSECSDKYHWMDDDIQPHTEETDEGELDATDEFDWLKVENLGLDFSPGNVNIMEVDEAGELSAELDVTDAKIRAEILDSLIDDRSDEEEGSGEVTLDIAVDEMPKKRPNKRGAKGKKGIFNVIRHAIHSRPTVDEKTYIRFEEEEKEALSHFDFLKFYPTNKENDDSTGKENVERGHVNVIEPTVVVQPPVKNTEIQPIASTSVIETKTPSLSVEGSKLDRRHSEKVRKVIPREKPALSKQLSLPEKKDPPSILTSPDGHSHHSHHVRFHESSLLSPSAEKYLSQTDNIPEEEIVMKEVEISPDSSRTTSPHRGSISGETRLRVPISSTKKTVTAKSSGSTKSPEHKSKLPEPIGRTDAVNLRSPDQASRTNEKSRSLEIKPTSPIKRSASLKSRSLDKPVNRTGESSPTSVRTVLTPSSPSSPEHRSPNRSIERAKVKLGVQAKYDHTRRRASGPAHLVSPGETELRTAPIYRSNSAKDSAKGRTLSTFKGHGESSRIPTAGNRNKKNSPTSPAKTSSNDSKATGLNQSVKLSIGATNKPKEIKDTKLWAPSKTKILSRSDRSMSLDSGTPLKAVPRRPTRIIPPKSRTKGVSKDDVVQSLKEKDDNDNDETIEMNFAERCQALLQDESSSSASSGSPGERVSVSTFGKKK